MSTEEEKRICALVVERLRQRFPLLSDELIVPTVDAIAWTFRDARIRDYIPLLIEREARDVLSSGLAARRQPELTVAKTSNSLGLDLPRSA